jgi:hypothetical protein
MAQEEIILTPFMCMRVQSMRIIRFTLNCSGIYVSTPPWGPPRLSVRSASATVDPMVDPCNRSASATSVPVIAGRPPGRGRPALVLQRTRGMHETERPELESTFMMP